MAVSEHTPLVDANGRVPQLQQAPAQRKGPLLVRIAVSWLLLFALVIGIASWLRSDSAAGQSSGAFCDPEAKHDIGYVKLRNKVDAHYFYWYFESRSAHPEKDPLLLWLSGGGSSIFAALSENGPCTVRSDLSTQPNPYAWNTNTNVLWIDQPVGQGFSYGADVDTDRTAEDAAENLYAFLQVFLTENHPELLEREFFVAGESYAGHYVPLAARYIVDKNKAINAAVTNTTSGSNIINVRINLQGIALGNGMVNPVIQYAYTADMAENAYNITILSDAERIAMKEGSKECIQLTQACEDTAMTCPEAQSCWNSTLYAPFWTSKRNVYDIRQECVVTTMCYDFSPVIEFLNSDRVYEYMGVDRAKVPVWEVMNLTITQIFSESGDWSMRSDQHVAVLLDAGLRVLVYAGDADLMCNWLGNQAWTNALEWKGKASFNAATQRPFLTKNPLSGMKTIGGELKTFDNLAFLRVYNSGHMVPMDQPGLALDMITRFLSNEQL
uniref:Carboxypeptidase n=1 Tax=Globisporangium ultimum (strain ATCC 200006 / CBS 805.95 / DAOM BR144) TaxID=431595 RepID=K3X2E5_GLOUD